MKIKINSLGNLEIERAGKFKAQVCPFRALDDFCGDWCPLFGETYMTSPYTGDPKHAMTICQGRILTGEIIDERVKS